MTNTRTLMGIICWMTVSATLTFATFEPVDAATPCASSRTTVTQVCGDLATGASAMDCEPILA
jgi:hypothetical protein